MARHVATINWQRRDAPFTDNRYSRVHTWTFDGGAEVTASSSPHVVPLPLSDGAAVDPEEAFVASISSCHMLWFLSIAAGRGFVVDDYRDDARGEMGPNAEGRRSMVRVVLAPVVSYAGTAPTPDEEMEVHHEAHELCFIANSVKTEIVIEPACKR